MKQLPLLLDDWLIGIAAPVVRARFGAVVLTAIGLGCLTPFSTWFSTATMYPDLADIFVPTLATTTSVVSDLAVGSTHLLILFLIMVRMAWVKTRHGVSNKRFGFILAPMLWLVLLNIVISGLLVLGPGLILGDDGFVIFGICSDIVYLIVYVPFSLALFRHLLRQDLDRFAHTFFPPE